MSTVEQEQKTILRVIETKDLPVVKDIVFEQLADKVNKIALNMETILDVVVIVMEEAEKLTDVHRKSWVIAVLKKLVELNPLISSSIRHEIENFLDKQLPALIEIVIAGTKGALAINQTVAETAETCWKSCWPSLSKNCKGENKT